MHCWTHIRQTTLISHQSKLTISTKIFTHNAKSNISFSASAVDLTGNQLCMCDPVSCNYTTQQVGISTSSSYNYSPCFERWVGPNYPLPFQVPVDMFILGCRVELLRFDPLLGQTKFLDQNSQTTYDHIWALTYSTHLPAHQTTCNRLFHQFKSTLSCSLPFNNFNKMSSGS